MDQKHRDYCIKLGNPFMKEEKYNEPFPEETSNDWVENANNGNDNWQNNTKKFTN